MPRRVARVYNQTQGTFLAERAEVADGFLRRGLGLMGRRGWSRGDALIINPCNSIHCLFMRMAIDAVFVGADDSVRLAVSGIRPWTPAVLALGARYVIELPAGTIERTRTSRGDRLSLEFC